MKDENSCSLSGVVKKISPTTNGMCALTIINKYGNHCRFLQCYADKEITESIAQEIVVGSTIHITGIVDTWKRGKLHIMIIKILSYILVNEV